MMCTTGMKLVEVVCRECDQIFFTLTDDVKCCPYCCSNNIEVIYDDLFFGGDGMARCPYCGRNIESVYLTEKVYVTYMVYVTGGAVYYSHKHSERLDDKPFVSCTECDVDIPLISERDVERFLREEIILARTTEVKEKGDYA